MKMKLRKPKRAKWGYVGINMAGIKNCIWITVEGSYNLITAKEARKFANWLKYSADWADQNQENKNAKT